MCGWRYGVRLRLALRQGTSARVDLTRPVDTSFTRRTLLTDEGTLSGLLDGVCPFSAFQPTSTSSDDAVSRTAG